MKQNTENSKKTEDEASIRERIIDCATELLGKKGYGALSVSAICKNANVSPPTIYWHFGNKEGLLAELLKDSLRKDADVFLSIDITDKPHHEAFEEFLIALRKIVISDRPNNWVILSSLSEARHAAPEISEIIAEARRRQVEYNAEQLRTHWCMDNNRMMVHLWLGYCNYISLLYHDTKNEDLVDDAIDSLRRTYFVLVGGLSEAGFDHSGFDNILKDIGYNPKTSRKPRKTSSSANRKKGA